MKRRRFMSRLGLGAGAMLLGPAVGRLISEAQGAPSGRCNLVVLSDGNGWGHQGMDRNSELLDTTVRSETDWDLPAVLSPLEPIRSRVTIARPLYNPFGRNLHGSGWATLNAAPTVSGGPGGPSLDRRVALEVGRDDAFPSIALGIGKRVDRPPPCTSSDGPQQPFPAIASPVQAFEHIFGQGTGSGQDPTTALSVEQSLLDGMLDDIERTRGALAGPERAKLDQLLESYRSLENSLVQRLEIFQTHELPTPPDPELDRTGLAPEIIRAHVDVVALALSFGLTRVAHLSIMGFDAHNAGWGAWGYGGDAHEDVAHVSVGSERATETYETIIRYKAGELMHLYQRLQQTPVEGGGTVADDTVFVWVNSGGGKHHNGNDYHPVVVIGDARGGLRMGRYLELPFREHSIADAFLAIAQALGVQADTFGDPEINRGPLPGMV